MAIQNMDKQRKKNKWNNAQGREIAKEILQEYGIKSKKAFDSEIKDIIAGKVIERMQAGKLILHPSGRRTPKKKLNMINSNGTSQSLKGCTGSYPVSGYIKSDGTKVDGYIRNCYKHSSLSEQERLAGQKKYEGKRMQDLTQAELEEAISYFI